MTMTPPAIGSLDLSMLDGAAAPAKKPEATGAASGFGEVLRSKLESLNEAQADGSLATKELASGGAVDVAQTMMRVEQANVSLQLATQVRNKAIEAYQEILRMQV